MTKIRISDDYKRPQRSTFFIQVISAWIKIIFLNNQNLLRFLKYHENICVAYVGKMVWARLHGDLTQVSRFPLCHANHYTPSHLLLQDRPLFPHNKLAGKYHYDESAFSLDPLPGFSTRCLMCRKNGVGETGDITQVSKLLVQHYRAKRYTIGISLYFIKSMRKTHIVNVENPYDHIYKLLKKWHDEWMGLKALEQKILLKNSFLLNVSFHV